MLVLFALVSFALRRKYQFSRSLSPALTHRNLSYYNDTRLVEKIPAFISSSAGTQALLMKGRSKSSWFNLIKSFWRITDNPNKSSFLSPDSHRNGVYSVRVRCQHCHSQAHRMPQPPWLHTWKSALTLTSMTLFLQSGVSRLSSRRRSYRSIRAKCDTYVCTWDQGRTIEQWNCKRGIWRSWNLSIRSQESNCIAPRAERYNSSQTTWHLLSRNKDGDQERLGLERVKKGVDFFNRYTLPGVAKRVYKANLTAMQ